MTHVNICILHIKYIFKKYIICFLSLRLSLSRKPFPIGDRVTFSGKDCVCQHCSLKLVNSNEPVKIHGPSRKSCPLSKPLTYFYVRITCMSFTFRNRQCILTVWVRACVRVHNVKYLHSLLYWILLRTLAKCPNHAVRHYPQTQSFLFVCMHIVHIICSAWICPCGCIDLWGLWGARADPVQLKRLCLVPG